MFNKISFCSACKALVVVIMILCDNGVAQPRMSVGSDTLFSFGNIYHNDRATHKVSIVNTGTSPLIIEQVNSPCKCSTTELEKTTIAPKDSALLLITFDSHSFEGEVDKEILIVSNNAEERNVSVRFSANVIYELSLLPKSLSFGEVPVGQREQLILSIKNQGRTAIRLRKISAHSKNLKITLAAKMLKPGTSTTLTVSIKPLHEGLDKGEIRIETSSSLQPLLTIPYQVDAFKDK